MSEGLKATPSGYVPTVIVLITVFAEGLITLTVKLLTLVVYASVPEGLKATPYGPEPTVIVLTTWLFSWFAFSHVHWPEYGPPDPPLITAFATVDWPTSIIVFDRISGLGVATSCAFAMPSTIKAAIIKIEAGGTLIQSDNR